MVDNLFGTDGIRAHIGSEPLTIAQLPQLGTALARWAQQRYGNYPRIALGHDTRASCDFAKSSIKSGLLLYPVTIYDASIIPTPALCHFVQHTTAFDCGIIISASHNPHYDNGIKIIDKHTGKLSHTDEQNITTLFYQPTKHCYTTFGNVVPWPQAKQLYKDFITTMYGYQTLQGKKIVLDCAYGATCDIAPTLFEQLGATVISLHTNPNGTNINHECGTLYVQQLQRTVIEHAADIGFAFDGDGDRVIAINRYGQIKNGDDILALLLEHPVYVHTKTVIGTIMTNHGFEQWLHSQDKKLIRTPVGDKYVAEQLTQQQLLIGGEQSGHIIMRDYLDTGDGIFTALRITQALTYSGNWDMITFNHYPQILINLPVAVKKDLTSPTVAAIIQMGNAHLQHGRLVVRYSGTENLLRIMIEDYELAHAQHVASLLAQALSKELS